MRLATLAVAAALLTVVVPAYAHNGPAPHDERGRHITEFYENSMTIEDDAYVQAGWWGNHGYSLDSSESSVDTDRKPEWLWIQSTTTDPQSRVTVTLETEGAVVGAIDVFKWTHEDGGGYHTPDCPQHLVEDLYPDQDEPLASYVFRLVHETVDYHQRGPNELEVSLDPKDSEDGYLVAIYPQAAAQTGEASLTWTVEPEAGEVTLRDDLEGQQSGSNAPIETNQWLLLDPLAECINEGVDLPPGLLPDELPEIPPSTQNGPTVEDLLGTGLPS